MTKNICVVTSTRADFGLLKNLMHLIKDSPHMKLTTLVTGTHLDSKFGHTVDELTEEGISADICVGGGSSNDTVEEISKVAGTTLAACGKIFSQNKFDLVILLGDRFEILSVAMAARLNNCAIAHIHGGETTLGALDDYFRHAITKLSDIHFVAAEEFRKRVVQMGACPDSVYQTGGMGVDNITTQRLFSLPEIEGRLKIGLKFRTLVVSLHPETASPQANTRLVKEMLEAIDCLPDTTLVFSSPNADFGSSIIRENIEDFVNKNSERAFLFDSLGSQMHLSLLAQSVGIIGNSSSGLLEAPTLRIGTVNIGDRQKGRLCATSVINVPAKSTAILNAIRQLFTPEFQMVCATTKSPYGCGGAAQMIYDILLKKNFDIFKQRPFHDYH